MKKLLLGICLLTVSQFGYSQGGRVAKGPGKNHNFAPAATKVISPISTQAAFWTDDFSNATNWVISNQTGNSDDWVIGTGVPSGSFAIPGITSTTAANGFALFDSDLLCSGDQIADLTTASSIDCSGETVVNLSWEQMYRRFDDSTIVFVSTDNVNWTGFSINASYTNNVMSATNPEVVTVDISSVAAGQSTVWIRFEFFSPSTFVGPGGAPGCGYAWMIDDVALTGGAIVYTNDDCQGATDINSVFGGAVGTTNNIGPFDNTTATSSGDPSTGWECFGEPDGSGTAPELNNTLWFTFTGDGSNYFVESGNCAGVTNYISDGDTQFALYTGSCGSLTPVKCNEDGPNATATTYPAGFSFSTTVGTQYYLMVDGFSFQGAVATGEFCLKVTKQTTVGCADPSITVGTVAANVTDLCFGDTLFVTATGAVTPNTGDYFGISWIISSADISASTDPLNDPALLATYTFTSPAPAVSTRQFVNDGTVAFLAPGATYFWTPIVFGNATAAAAPQFLSDLTLDNACIVLGPSLQVNVLVDGDPLCSGVGINETAASAYGISSVFPVPAKDNVNFTINAKENAAVTISIKNNLGQEIASRQVVVNKGKNDLSFDLKGNAAGFYFINVSGDKGNYNVKFVKQ